jgi:hypothetical protein
MNEYQNYILTCILIIQLTGEKPFFPFDEEEDYAEPATLRKQ